LIGRRFSDPEVQKDKKLLPYEIKEASDGGVEIKMGDKWLKPAEISAMILQKLKSDAEEKLGEKIEEAIITCPAYFDDSQRKATKVAGEIAGFKVRRVINEPTAAALAYGSNKKGNKNIVVYDFGGGTFDVSILEISDDTIEVKSTGGDTHLGGEDIDQRIIEWMVEEFQKDQGIDLSKDNLTLQRLKEAAEKAKIELSTSMETDINLPFITSDSSGPKHLSLRLTRAKLEDITSDYIKRSMDITEKTLSESKMTISDVSSVILVGGQTRMPKIQEELKKMFNQEPCRDINPDEVVAAGAAVQAGILQGDMKDVLLLDVAPLSLGIETMGGVNTTLISKNTTIPTGKTQIFSTAADNQPSVEIHVLQGERPMASDNKTLGRFMLDGISPAPRGVPQIEVKFDIDANGILSVSAKDTKTGKEQSIRIEGSCGISDEEVERMKREAEEHAAEDKKKQELITARNEAETLIYMAEKEEGLKEEVEELKKLKDSEDKEAIVNKTKEVSEKLQKITAEKQKQQAEKPEDKKEEKPEEGEYKEKE